MLKVEALQKRIADAIDGADVEVKDLTGTGDHFEARVVSPQFVGKAMVDQHQLVYRAVDDLLKSGELHALALRTFSPEQWSQLNRPKKT